ncbi:MAG: cell division protein FtsA [Anaerolineae bacterium]|nr:cell division protein FtsA [Anaerolineae bacterium]
MGDLVVGIDIGTTKVCTIVGEVRPEDIFIVGLGIEPGRGLKKGTVTDMTALSTAIAASVHKAERVSGYDISRAFISLAGSHMASINSVGTVGLVGNRGVTSVDMDRAIENARAIAIPHSREVLHVVPRSYSLDGQDHIPNPLGMHGFRLDAEVHIITVSTSSVANLEQSVQAAGVFPDRFILNPLASGDAVLTDVERDMGVVVIDIGGGTTDIGIFVERTIWHSAVIPVGGDMITNDITHWMHVSFDVAEAVKVQHGFAREKGVSETETFLVQPFGEGMPEEIKRGDLAMVIEARVSEIFELVQNEIKRSGYDDLLRAGAVLTGGCALLPGIRDVAAEVLGCPVRIARPEKLTGMADTLRSPAFSTSIGLLRLGLQMDTLSTTSPASNGGGSSKSIGKRLGDMFKRLLPDEG